jgi:hypothetical protein
VRFDSADGRRQYSTAFAVQLLSYDDGTNVFSHIFRSEHGRRAYFVVNTIVG